MTSKHLFFKAIGEDLRHKIWMVALAVLGCFLVLPVAWLFYESNMPTFLVNQDDEFIWTMQRLSSVVEFFGEYVCIMGGVLTIAGALITGLFGFRYVFHKNMVDTYHSLPIKRRTLFGACYTNGILIWFLPFFFFLLLTLFKASAFLHKVGGGRLMAALWREAALSFLILAVVYLLVYNLVLVAVMLSGNMLNTLVNLMILGLGIIGIYGIGYSFFARYMDFFYSVQDWGILAYFSPLVSAPYLIYCREELSYGYGSHAELLGRISINFLLAAALGLCAWLLYRRRASELSEQGTKNRPAVVLMRLAVSVGAGMCGWQFFSSAFDNTKPTGWGIFGVVFATVLVFGIMDIIFHMEFKAFFAHKLQMAMTVILTMLICFAFRWDWIGYDRYLPSKDQIESIAVYDRELANRYMSQESEWYPLENMSIGDADAIYAYLECMISGEDIVRTGRDRRNDWVTTKVTLKNGRTYYRNYLVHLSDKEAVWPLLASGEYVKYAYGVSDNMMQNMVRFYMARGGKRVEVENVDLGAFVSIARAYNLDILENPECVLTGSDRLLTRIDCTTIGSDGSSERFSMSVYETMARTVEALRQAGLGEWTVVEEASNIQAIQLTVDQYYQATSLEDMIEMARETYGVYEPDVPKEAAGETGASASDIIQPESVKATTASIGDWESALIITDRTEVEELLSLISYAEPYYSSSVFCSGYTEVSYFDVDGNKKTCYIPLGTLPEKYILRFGELLK